MPPISETSVRSDIQRQHDGQGEPVTGPRIEVPARSVHCKHLQCFDLSTYLKERDRNLLVGDSSTETPSVYWNCPICGEAAELPHLRVDGYFKSVLKAYEDLRIVEEVEILSDGNHRPVVQPKAEVIPVSESPFLRGESSNSEHPELKPHIRRVQDVDDNDHNEDTPSVETTDLTLEDIERLPETSQLCKAVKRRLLDDFKRAQKKRMDPTTQNDEPMSLGTGGSPASGGSEGEGLPRLESVDGVQEEGGSPDITSGFINENAPVAVQYYVVPNPFEKLACDLCTGRFGSKQALQDHKHVFHAVAKEFKCDLCVKEYFTAEELALHKEAKHGPRMILCGVCFKRFGSAHGLSDHQKVVHGFGHVAAPAPIPTPYAAVPRLRGPLIKPPATAPRDVVDEYYRQLGVFYEQRLMASTL